ncbi:TIGR03013 family PEP-CTERM/XrtA system glycosyltransferase [Sphingomonas sanguinis]|uniref:TIGR03013 family XrtA/PEP-CTERM system glycosyltransferase n=1 Tax=Sphingomonas sp. LC-1 TaxID=3110957 RepID=UPI0021BAD9C3|nr:TIGR03013 family XrtA/PEP-CTERM system glycosyltransferase [Sphingomonas sp. LC-1]MCT8003215.1 TIGR03013 family PEP-CTERM/XrtA system glycosyltransferase [Sphingomonas sp. LC-1]
MIRLFKHYVPHAALLLGLVDFVLLMAAAELGWLIRARQIGYPPGSLSERLPQVLSFAIPLQIALLAVGGYAAASFLSLRFAAARLMVAVSMGVIFLSLIFFFFPSLSYWRSSLFFSMILAVVMLVSERALMGRILGGDRFKRRVILMGAGERAAAIMTLAGQPGTNFLVAGAIAMNAAETAVAGAIPRADIPNLRQFVLDREASEVVLALQERRNALPYQDLLRVRTTGVQVCELSSFLERQTGRIDLASVSHSWLIFSEGFASGRMWSAMFKRAFDISVSLILLVFALPVILITAIAIRLESRGPAFYRQRRIGLFNEPFDILKLRSMRQDAEVAGHAVWAEKDDPRITRIGRFIRKVRIDELPQIWSVLMGEMSFVGPRPERPQFVEQLERDIPFYAERHMVKPGITGWAQLNYPYGASIDDARHKLEYDLYYAKNYSPFLDALILLQTLRVILWPTGAR